MQRTNFHTTNYGWNYFFEIAKTGAIRVGRYLTNGHVNGRDHVTRWGVTKTAPTSSEECDLLMMNNR